MAIDHGYSPSNGTAAFRLRSAELHEAEYLAAIAAENPTAPQWSATQFQEMLRPPALGGSLCRSVLVAEDAGEIAGFAVVSALCTVFPVEAELESLAVAPAWQGRGMGTALLQAILAWAAEQGAETLRLEVRASNERALRIYAKAGFRQTGRRPAYYTAPLEDAVVMERVLHPSSGGSPTRPLA